MEVSKEEKGDTRNPNLTLPATTLTRTLTVGGARLLVGGKVAHARLLPIKVNHGFISPVLDTVRRQPGFVHVFRCSLTEDDTVRTVRPFSVGFRKVGPCAISRRLPCEP